MGLCYSLRPLLFGGPEDAPCEASEPPGEDARPTPAPAPAPVPGRAPARAAGGDAARTLLSRAGGGCPACARPTAAPQKEKRRRGEPPSAEEREAAREAKRVSRGIDRMLREQKRDLQQTHRLLLLGFKRTKMEACGPSSGIAGRVMVQVAQLCIRKVFSDLSKKPAHKWMQPLRSREQGMLSLKDSLQE